MKRGNEETRRGLEAWWVVEKMVWQFWFALVSKPRKSIGLERRFDCWWPRDLPHVLADPLRADCWVGDTVGDGTEDVEVEKPPWPGGEDQEGVEPKSCRHKILMTHWADKLGKERCLTEIVKYVFGKEAKNWKYSSRLAVRLPTIQALLGNPGGQWSSLSELSLFFMKSTPRANSCESCRGLSTSLICTRTSTGELAWNNLQWRGISVRVESCKEA